MARRAVVVVMKKAGSPIRSLAFMTTGRPSPSQQPPRRRRGERRVFYGVVLGERGRVMARVALVEVVEGEGEEARCGKVEVVEEAERA